jgi:hypothetical protein
MSRTWESDFCAAWPDRAIVQAPLAQITWYHNIALLEKVSSKPDRLWYARAAIQHGWSQLSAMALFRT